MLINILLFNLVGLIHEPVPSVDVIYSARYYYDDARKSRYQIYLRSLDGKKKRQLTFSVGNCFAPMWLDRNHVAYYHEVSESPLDSKYQRIYKAQIEVIDIRTRHHKVLKKIQTNDSYPEVKLDLKSYWIERPYTPPEQMHDQYQVTPIGVKVIPNQEYLYHKLNYEVREYQEGSPDPYSMAFLDIKGYRGAPTIHLKWGDQGLYDRFIISQGNVVRKFSLQGQTLEHVETISPNKLFVITAMGPSRTDNSHVAYSLDMKSGSAKLLLEGVGDVQFTQNREFWVGDDPSINSMTELSDGKRIFVGGLYAGSIKSGRRWFLAQGLVALAGFQLRPQK